VFFNRSVLPYFNPIASLIQKKKGRNSYYYIVESARVNGKPRIVRQTYLGTPDNLLRKLQTPSPMIQEPLEVDSLDFGATSALWAQTEELDLIGLIDQVIPQNSNREISVGAFLTVRAINRAIHPESKDGIGPWMSKTILPRLIEQKASALDS